MRYESFGNIQPTKEEYREWKENLYSTLCFLATERPEFAPRKRDSLSTFEIYFNDLNEDAQKRLLEAVGAETSADMNWDINICPIATYDFETETE